MDPFILGSAMGDLFPIKVHIKDCLLNDALCLPWKSGYICKSFVSSVKLSVPLWSLSASRILSRTAVELMSSEEI